MAKKKKTKESRVSAGLQRIQEMVFTWFKESGVGERLTRLGLIVLISAAVLGGTVLGLKHLESYVGGLPLFTSSEVSVAMYDQPVWMSESLATQILTESFQPIKDDLVELHRQGQDQKLPEVLNDQLAKNPWVSKVHWVRRSFGGKFMINADFREPAAMVQMEKGCYLIDNEGVLLPGKYKYNLLADCGLLEIHGCRGEVPDAGKKWKSVDLQAGLELVKLLQTSPFKHQVKAVDVTNYQGRSDPASSWLVVMTDRRTVIRWGRPMGQEQGLETTAHEKLSLLAGAFVKFKHIDCNRSFVDVRRSATEVDASVAAAAGGVE
jgi:hypothetical protein